MESAEQELLDEYGFSFERLVQSPHPNARPLIQAILEKNMVNGHSNPSEVIEELMSKEGDKETRTADGIPVRKIVHPDGSITIQAGDNEENQAEAVRQPGDLTSVGLYIHKVVEAVRTKLAERTD
ncbi:MAG: hypothetical protein ABIA92_01545 [Patescibacteria group bacterium]